MVLPRRRLAIAATIALGLLTTMGLVGLLLTATSSPAHVVAFDSSGSSHSDATTARNPQPPLRINPTTDAERFAGAVARSLFTWDTATTYDPSDYAQTLVDVAAVSGEEDAAVASDVRAFLPTPAAWDQLRTYATRQWLTIDATYLPKAWSVALAQAAPGQLASGTVAYTVEGTRHRSGIWGTEPIETSRPVAFTVFLVCTPTSTSTSTCELLRLSQLDNPLR